MAGWLEQPAPKRVKDDSITALDVYGSLYYAGARTLQARLPQIRDAKRPVVIIRLRGRTSLGSTSLTVLSGYGDRLAEAGGRLYLSGVDADLAALFRKTRTVTKADDSVQLFEATPIIGESSRQAFAAAEEFLAAGNEFPAAEGRLRRPGARLASSQVGEAQEGLVALRAAAGLAAARRAVFGAARRAAGFGAARRAALGAGLAAAASCFWKNSSAVRVLVCWLPLRLMPFDTRKARASAATWNASFGKHLVDSSRMRDPSW